MWRGWLGTGPEAGGEGVSEHPATSGSSRRIVRSCVALTPWSRCLMPRRMMLQPLKREEFVDRSHRTRIAALDAHFPAPGPIDLVICDRTAARRHHTRPGHGLGMHLEGLGEVARAKRRLDVAQMRANHGDGDGV